MKQNYAYLIVIIIISVYLNFHFANENSKLETELENLDSEIATLQSEYDFSKDQDSTLESDFNELKKYFNEIREYALYLDLTLLSYQSDFAYYTETGNRYHKFTCPSLSNANAIYVATIYECESMGYTECLICEGDYRKVSLSDEYKRNWSKYATY